MLSLGIGDMLIRELAHEALEIGEFDRFAERMGELVSWRYTFDDTMKNNGEYPKIQGLRNCDIVKVLNRFDTEGKVEIFFSIER